MSPCQATTDGSCKSGNEVNFVRRPDKKAAAASDRLNSYRYSIGSATIKKRLGEAKLKEWRRDLSRTHVYSDRDWL